MRLNYAQLIGVAVLFGYIILLTLFTILPVNGLFVYKDLLSVLNIVFQSGALFAVAFISANSYLKSGLPQLLLIGTGMISLATAVLIHSLSPLYVTIYNYADFTVSVHNIGLLVFALFILLTAIILVFKQKTTALNKSKLKTNITLSYVGITVLMIFFATLAYLNIAPDFVLVAGGFSILRQVILAVTISLLAISSIIFIWLYFENRTNVLYWCAMALALYSISVGIIAGIAAIDTPLSWLGRFAQYTASIYFIIALLSAQDSPRWTSVFKRTKLQFEYLFRHMSSGFTYAEVIADDEGKPVDYILLEINEAFSKITGLTRDAIGKRLTFVLPKIQQTPINIISTFGNVAFTQEPIHTEYYSQYLNKWFYASAYSPQNGYVALVFTDITERKKAEDKLKESEQLYRSIGELIPFGIWETDPQGGVTYQSQSFFDMVGMSFDEVKQFGWLSRYRPEKISQFLMDWKKTLQEGTFWKYEHDIKDKNGNWQTMLSRGFPLKDENGKIVKWVGINVDITDLKKTEAALKKRTHELECVQSMLKEYATHMEALATQRANQLKAAERLAAIGATAGMVGHDIRNPLQAITGDLYLAKIDLASLPNSPEKESLNQTLTAIEENINYISKIVADLQDYARIPNPSFQRTDLKQVIDTILTKNNTPNNINIITNISEEATTLTTDTIYLQRIINNLITNAIYAMPDGGTLTIQATKNTQTDKIILTIKDTGIGIPKAVQTKIFNPLFTTRSKGQGLGLSVVKRFTEALDGTISFESQEGRGTTFTITLPIQKKQK